jgi:hypothetical protein
MDISKWKLEVYDLLAIILPGLLVISEGWILIRGWDSFAKTVGGLTATGLTLIVLVSFGAGALVQELSDFFVKRLTNARYFKRGRDRFWSTDEADPVKRAIKAQLGIPVSSVDTAFDYCLTKLKGAFPRRDMFVATSDLCRSFAVLSLLAIVPATRIAFQTFGLHRSFFVWAGISVIVAAAVFFLSWRRMVRFRELSETTVFRAYLATVNEPAPDLEVTR